MSELRIKKLRGSGGYVMARVSDQQQTKGNLGGPDLFLAPIGRLDPQYISKHFCNTCEKEYEGAPKVEFQNPNEEVASNLILAEKGKYVCASCSGTIAEYREFKKQDEAKEVGVAKPLETEPARQSQAPPQEASQEVQSQDDPVNSIEGKAVYDENANKIGTAKQVGIDSSQKMVLVITKNDGTQQNIPWSGIKKIGQVVLLGSPDVQDDRCPSCQFSNKAGSKFCEECGTKL